MEHTEREHTESGRLPCALLSKERALARSLALNIARGSFGSAKTMDDFRRSPTPRLARSCEGRQGAHTGTAPRQCGMMHITCIGGGVRGIKE